MTIVPFPWGLVAWDLGFAALMAIGCVTAYRGGDRTGALAGAVLVGAMLLLALVTCGAWVYFELRHRRLRAEESAARERWAKARADLDDAARDLADIVGRQMADAMRGRAP